MTRCVPWSWNDFDIARQLVASGDWPVVFALEMQPRGHRVVTHGSSFVFRTLNKNGRAREQAVIAAVIEVEVGVYDGVQRARSDAVLGECAKKIDPPRLSERLDDRVVLSDAGIDEENRFAVTNQEREDITRAFALRMRSRQRNCYSDRNDLGSTHLALASAA